MLLKAVQACASECSVVIPKAIVTLCCGCAPLPDPVDAHSLLRACSGDIPVLTEANKSMAGFPTEGKPWEILASQVFLSMLGGSLLN